MTKQELSDALFLARDMSEDLSNVDDTPLFGYGLTRFKTAYVTIRAVARMIRWQCIQMNGGLDGREFDNLAKIFRHKVQIIGG
jgi:hypothetical protein